MIWLRYWSTRSRMDTRQDRVSVLSISYTVPGPRAWMETRIKKQPFLEAKQTPNCT